jgi:serine/threonine protein phosphatase PrpC
MYQQKPFHETAAFHIDAAGRTDTGRRREHNEDAIALCEPPDQATAAQLGWLYLLADGAGGLAAGEVASRIAIETISSVYYDQSASSELSAQDVQAQGIVRYLHEPLPDLEAATTHIRRAFLAAHKHIVEQSMRIPAYSGMATTCVAAVVKDTHLLVAHIGDSRAYLLQPSAEGLPTLIRLTTDHSLVMELARIGVISPEHTRSSPYRNILLRLLGGIKNNNPCPDIVTCVVHAGDHLILCCDGLWSMLTEEQITLVVSRNTPRAACDELIRLANAAGGEDNISVVVLSFTQVNQEET